MGWGHYCSQYQSYGYGTDLQTCKNLCSADSQCAQFYYDGSCKFCAANTEAYQEGAPVELYVKDAGGAASCIACEADTYKNFLGNDACLPCADNSQSPAGSDASTDCICNAGYTGADGGPCDQCPVNTFKSIVGSSGCTASVHKLLDCQ